MTDEVLGKITILLSRLSQEKPWMTARAIARKLKVKHGIQLSQEEVEDILIAHSKLPNRKIRYSYYPSKKTLDVLWGHMASVGSQKNLPELDSIDEPLPQDEPDAQVNEQSPWFFISHNSRDLKQVLELKKLLSNKKYGAWIFEAEIPQHGQIASNVQEAIANCQYFMVYVSGNSIGSLWVQKEFEQAKRGKHIKPFIVVDGADQALLALFENWKDQWPPERDETKQFCIQAAEKIGLETGSRWAGRSEEFMNSLREYVSATKCIAGYPMPQREWNNKELELLTIEVLLERIAQH